MKTQQTALSQMILGNASPLCPNDDRPPLPEGWRYVPVSEVLDVQYGKGLTKDSRDESGSIPVYGSNGIVGYHTEALVREPCIVIGRKGAAGVVHYAATPCWPIDTAYYAIPRINLLLGYVVYYLQSVNLGALDKSTAIPSLSRDDLYAQSVPLAPLPEQHRIVAAIETQFTRLDAAVAALERAKANLARYKASVLKAACEGRLVPTDAALYHDRCDYRGEETPHASTIAQMRGNACRGEATPQATPHAKMRGDAEIPDQEEPGGGCLAPTDAGADAGADTTTRTPATDTRGFVGACVDDAYMHDACRGEATPQASPHAKMRGDAKALGQEEPGGGCLAPTDMDAVDAACEPADVLLHRILAERRARWVADNPGKRYIEPAAPDTSGLPDLPEGWVWATVEQIGDVIGGLTKNTKRMALPLQLPYLRVANVYANELRLDDVQKTGVEDKELDRLLLKKGDLLIVEGNGSVDQIGRVAIWNGMIDPCVHQNHIIKIRLDPIGIGRFVLVWLLSLGGRDQIVRVASSTSGLYTLSISKVSALLIPLPPLAEQHRIVAEVERRLSVVAEVEASIDANLTRAARLRQAILREAFAGRLVPRGDGDVGMGA